MALFSESNRRGLLYLLPLVAIIILLIALAHPRDDRLVFEPLANKEEPEAQRPDTLFRFDPNTATFEELVQLGLSKRTSASIIKYRTRGKVFSIAEDFAACYGVTDSMYRRLKPYIDIAAEYRPKPFRYDDKSTDDSLPIKYEPFRIDTVTIAYLRTIGFSHRRAAAFLRYRDMRGGLRNIEEVGECYVIGDAELDTLARHIIFPQPEQPKGTTRIELNGADSATLRSIYGIGEKSVMEIIGYRRRLGGFSRVEQLAEVKNVTESNYEKILQQIYCDSSVISKIDVNFASPQSMAGHPYISDRALRKLLKTRQLKGGWSTIEEMVEDKIFTRDEAERLRPYLRFTSDRE